MKQTQMISSIHFIVGYLTDFHRDEMPGITPNLAQQKVEKKTREQRKDEAQGVPKPRDVLIWMVRISSEFYPH